MLGRRRARWRSAALSGSATCPGHLRGSCAGVWEGPYFQALIGLLRIAHTIQIRDLTIEQVGSAACGGLPRIPLHAGPHQVSDLEVAQGVLIFDSLFLDLLLHHAAAAFARLQLMVQSDYDQRPQVL